MPFETHAKTILKKLDAENARHISKKRELEAALEELRSECASECTHSLTVKFSWEWDNGYGRQEMCTGLYCQLCGRRNHYPNSSGQWLR